MIKDGSLSHNILVAVAARRKGVSFTILHKQIGGKANSMRVQLSRHVTSGYLTTFAAVVGVPNHKEHTGYIITDKGRDALIQLASYEPPEDEPEVQEAPDVVKVYAVTATSIWDLARIL